MIEMLVFIIIKIEVLSIFLHKHNLFAIIYVSHSDKINKIFFSIKAAVQVHMHFTYL